MQQVNLPKKTTDSTKGNQPMTQNFNGPNFSGGNSFQTPASTQSMSSEQRIQMIEAVYQEVLGRQPDTRDINYYKYSTLTEDEIRRQLLGGKEHKQLLSDGFEFRKMRERAEQAETRVTMLESQIKDQVVEFRQLNELLSEKNRYINELRALQQNPYNLSHPIDSSSDQQYQYVNRGGQASQNTNSGRSSNSTGPEYNARPISSTPVIEKPIYSQSAKTIEQERSPYIPTDNSTQIQPKNIQAARPQFTQNYGSIPEKKKSTVIDYIKDIFSV